MGVPSVRRCRRKLRILVDGRGAETTGDSWGKEDKLAGEESTKG